MPVVHMYHCPGPCANPQTVTHPLAFPCLLCNDGIIRGGEPLPTHTQTTMKTILTAIAALAAATLTVLPAGATPERRIVAFDEMQVLVPGLEELGYSRISTVLHCSDIVGTDHLSLITDSDFESFENCLKEHT